VCGGGFAAERSARRTYRSTAAGAAARRSAANALQHAAQQQMRRGTPLSSKCGQCMLTGQLMRLYTDLLS